VLVYSTCTFAPEENEGQVAWFLTAHPDWDVLDLPTHPGFTPGRPDWTPAGPPALARTVRLWPHHLRGEGHFIAKLGHLAEPEAGGSGLSTAPWGGRGRGSGQGPQSPRGHGAVVEAWRGFAAEALVEEPVGVRVVGERVYGVVDEEVAAAGVRLVRPGLLMGRVRPGRFEPAHALGMVAGPGLARRARELDDGEAAAWVRGGVLGHDGPGGWTLVRWNGWPLGWGRAVGGSLKNHYPKGLRTM
jgi:NOL1/NOP2/fmu family ribosome biogenesis protein